MFKAGDKVKVIGGKFKYMSSYRGKTGKVVAGVSITKDSCRVKLAASAGEFWFDNEELEKI